MRVIQVVPFGGLDVLVLGEVVEPVAGPRQAVMEVVAADVLFLDSQLREG